MIVNVKVTQRAFYGGLIREVGDELEYQKKSKKAKLPLWCEEIKKPRQTTTPAPKAPTPETSPPENNEAETDEDGEKEDGENSDAEDENSEDLTGQEAKDAAQNGEAIAPSQITPASGKSTLV